MTASTSHPRFSLVCRMRRFTASRKACLSRAQQHLIHYPLSFSFLIMKKRVENSLKFKRSDSDDRGMSLRDRGLLSLPLLLNFEQARLAAMLIPYLRFDLYNGIQSH